MKNKNTIKSCFDKHVQDCDGNVKFTYEQYEQFWLEHQIGDIYMMKNTNGSEVECKVAYYPLKDSYKEVLNKYREVVSRKPIVHKDLRALVELKKEGEIIYQEVPIYYLRRVKQI